MRTVGKITLPYPFCLLLAALGLVGFMGSIIAWEAHRDARMSEPRRASDVVHGATNRVVQHLAGHFEPVKAELANVQRWVSGGIFPEGKPHEWPGLLLPAFAPSEPVFAIQVQCDDGVSWFLERDGQGWTGYFSEAHGTAPAAVVTHWADDGTRHLSEKINANRYRVEAHAWPEASWEAGTGPGEGLHTTVPNGDDATMILTAPVRFTDGQRGRVSVGMQCADLFTRIADEARDGVRVQLDVGAHSVGQVQDPQILVLLQEQAVPASTHTGLDVLFARIRKGQEEPWYGARSYDVGTASTGAWWVLASVDGTQLPPPPLFIGRYLMHALAAGALAACALAWLLGRMIVRPLRQVAARAQTIQSLDEHYLPWPDSRFTEVNTLTFALEELYDTAVEHLDYHDAPLVVWAQSESDEESDAIEAEAVRHVMKMPRSNGNPVETTETSPVIDVEGTRDIVPTRQTATAAQIQVLQGSRREVRRLQGQLAGAFEALRTTETHQRNAEARAKQQRSFLRSLEATLQEEGAISPTALNGLRNVLDATRVSLWIQTTNPARFRLRFVSGDDIWTPCTLTASFRFRSLLMEETLVNAPDGNNDPRLDDVRATEFYTARTTSVMLVPLRAVSQVLGFLLLEQQGAVRRWKADEELFLVAVVAQSSPVLWQQLRKRAGRDTPRVVASIYPAAPRNGGEHHHGNGHGNGHRNGNGDTTRDHAGENVLLIRWEADLAGCIQWVEGDVDAAYGRSVEDLLGQPITFLSESRQGARDLDRYSALLSGVPCHGYETTHLTAAGSEFRLQVRASVLRDGNGSVTGARGTARCVHVAVPG